MGNASSALSFLCDDVEFFEEYTEAMRKLRKFIEECSIIYYQIEKLKSERYGKAQNHFVIDSSMSEESDRQLKEYCHLMNIQEELNKISEQNTALYQKYTELKAGNLRAEAIIKINEHIEQTSQQLVIINEKIDLIRKGEIKYTEKQDEFTFLYKNTDHHAFRVEIIQKERNFLSEKLEETEKIRANYNKSEGLKKGLPFEIDEKIKRFIDEKQSIEAKISESWRAIELLPENNKTYIYKVFGEKPHPPTNQIIYKKLNEKDIQYALKQFGVKKLEEETFELGNLFNLWKLDHSCVKIEDMEGFTSSLEWKMVSILNLVNCQIDDKLWRVLCENANNFPELRILWISENFIENMKLEDLYRFPKLEFAYYENLHAENMKEQKIINNIQAYMEKEFNIKLLDESNKKRKRNLRVFY